MARPPKRRGRGEGTITQLPDGRWQARLRLGKRKDGKRRRRVFYGKTKAEVLEKLRDAQATRVRAVKAKAGTMTVGEWLDRWLGAKKGQVEAGTYGFYERRVRLRLKPTIGDLLLAELEPLNVVEMHAELTRLGVSATEQHKVATTLRAALADAVDLELILVNAAKRVKKPKASPKEMHPLDLAQARAFLNEAIADRLFAYYAAALDTGARPGELFALHWPDLDLEARTVFIHRSLEEIDGRHRLKETKTPKSRRTLVLARSTVATLREHRRRMEAEGHAGEGCPVFCDTRGGYLRQSNLRRSSFLKILKRAKLPQVRPYDLRHTCATLLLLKGANVKLVSERLGHESVEITLKHYAHVLPSMQQQAADLVEEMFGHQMGTGAVRAESGKVSQATS
jgi:integrase